jgi:hypothetical protein
VNPFVAGKPVNVSDIYWSLPMSEAEGSAFIKSRPDRDVKMKVMYSVTKKQEMLGNRAYLVPLIESVEIFSDVNLMKRLGVLSMARRDETREGQKAQVAQRMDGLADRTGTGRRLVAACWLVAVVGRVPGPAPLNSFIAVLRP